ncbi:MAG TPA: hypothetical protein VG844_18165 [Terracidiphilus sp.]|nr:hypothetical protein [Terracidiphilus sp.]
MRSMTNLHRLIRAIDRNYLCFIRIAGFSRCNFSWGELITAGPGGFGFNKEERGEKAKCNPDQPHSPYVRFARPHF